MSSATAADRRVTFVTPSGTVVIVTERDGEFGPSYLDPKEISRVEWVLQLKDADPKLKSPEAQSKYEALPEAPETVMSMIRA